MEYVTPNEAWKTLSTTCKETTKALLCVKNPTTKTINIEWNTNIIFTAKEIKERNRIYQ